VNSTLFIVLIGRIVQVVISLASVRIYTKLLSTGEVGNIFLINSIVGLFALTLINPVGMYINRRLHKWSDDKTVINFFFLYNAYLIFISIASVLIVGVLNKSLGVGSSIDLKLLSLFIMLNIYFNTWNLTIIPSLNMLQHVRSFVLFSVITLLLGLTFSVTFVTAINPTAVYWLSGQVMAQVAVTMLAFAHFKRITGTVLNLDLVKAAVTKVNFSRILAFVLPLTITTFFMWVQNQSYRMIIERYIGLEFLGMIGVGMGIATSLSATVESIVLQVYNPIYYSEINTSDPEKRAIAWDKMARLTIPIYLSVTILVSCLAPFLVKILVNDKFSGVFVFVIYGAWVEFFRMTTNVLSSVAHSEMQTRSLILAYFAGGFLAFFGVYLCSTFDLSQFIPAILVVSGFVTMSTMYLNMKNLIKINLGADLLARPLALSMPFAISLFFYSKSGDLRVSLLSTFIAGLYLMYIYFPTYKSMRN